MAKTAAELACDQIAILAGPNGPLGDGKTFRCGLLSEILIKLLSIGGIEGRRVTGTCNGIDHVWVVCDGEILDPTKEQFHPPRKYIEDAEPPEVSTDDNL